MLKYFLIVALIGVVSAQQCSPICPAVWSPVCTQDQDGVIQRYDNDCLRKNAECRNPNKKLTILTLDKCDSTRRKRDTCPKFCTYEFAPVCGENNQNQRIEFPNQCAFNQKQCQNPTENWRILPGKNACNPLLRTKRETCVKACTFEYAPVCGVNSENKREEFPNQCAFDQKKCENPTENWRILPGKNACNPLLRTKRETCAKACTFEYAPVCGVNSENKREEFPNQCAFDQKKCENPTENWRILPGRNACNPLLRTKRDTVKPKCSHACPDILLPVCAVNKSGKSLTFANDCEMKIEQCENENAEWKMLRQGNCD